MHVENGKVYIISIHLYHFFGNFAEWARAERTPKRETKLNESDAIKRDKPSPAR